MTATYSRSQNGVGASMLNLAGRFTADPNAAILRGSRPRGAADAGHLPVGTAGTNADLTDSLGNTFQAAGPVGSGSVTIDSFSVTARFATGKFNFVVVQSGGIATKVIAAERSV